ncbi:hypothetical protein AB0A70_03690 [Streptomyces morookaense]|uniref:hypothetical protein n=1 Tax=Streptomyces morookaense TaxID=1970 RepID=UPI0033F56C33
MDSFRIALCGAVTAAVAVCTGTLSAGPARAADGPATMSGTIELTPVSARPGSEVQLRISGCRSERATATSEAFVSDARLAKDSAGLFAEATIRQTARAGTYPVKVMCDGYNSTAQGRLTVVPYGRDLPEPQAAPQPPEQRSAPVVHDGLGPHEAHTLPGGHFASPVAPVPAGGGGTARVAVPEAPDTPGLVLAGTTAAIAGGLIWYRRRTDGRQQR